MIDNESDDPATLDYLASLPHRVLRIPNRDGRFSFAAINNTAAAMVEEDLLLFLNDDTEVINPRWLSQMVGWSRLEGVGAVGRGSCSRTAGSSMRASSTGFHEGLAGHAFRLLPWWDSGHLQPRAGLAQLHGRHRGLHADPCGAVPPAGRLRRGPIRRRLQRPRLLLPPGRCRLSERLLRRGRALSITRELSRGFVDDPREPAAYREVHGHRVDPYFSPHFDPEIETFQAEPTVVPIGPRSRPIPLLAVTHNLNWEGAPRFEFELIVRRLHAAGAIRAEVLSPCDGPAPPGLRGGGDPDPGRTRAGRARRPSTGSSIADAIARLAEHDRATAATRSSTPIPCRPSGPSRPPATPGSRRSGACTRASPGRRTSTTCRGRSPHRPSPAWPTRTASSSPRECSPQVWGDLDTSGNFELIRFAHDVPRLLPRDGTAGLAPRPGSELDLEDRGLCVLLLGTVCERKGQHDLLRAFAALPGADRREDASASSSAWRDTLAYSRKLQKMAGKLPDDRRDRFVVIPETGETSAYWRAADVFCCTSRVESYPLVIMEAMAAGLPIVTTPVFGIAEQVRPSVNALTYQPGDFARSPEHLALLVQDEGQRRSLAEASTSVLRSLPDDARMDALYRRTFLAAAESAPLVPRTSQRTAKGRHDAGHGRIWMADAANRGAWTQPRAARPVIQK